ncbi:MAG: MGMT family protein [candidate division Zixibacteria bacterium]|nr:MGMT family protein [candidate division Zixibacteria bacterium]
MKKTKVKNQPEGLFVRIYRLVNSIPRGKVTTYGTIARVLGNPRLSRRVGFAMASLPQGSAVPWYRVVGKNGITVPPPYNAIQKSLLTKEKVRFDKNGRPLEKYFHQF